MTDNRALWDLYDRWLDEARRCHAAGLDVAAGQYQSRAAELAAILDRPVVVTSEDARMVADEYFRLCKQDDEKPMAHGMWTERLRLAIESMVRGKS